MTNQNKKLSSDERLTNLIERIGVGLLYSITDLGQNSIAKMLGISDGRVNDILKGIKKPGKK